MNARSLMAIPPKGRGSLNDSPPRPQAPGASPNRRGLVPRHYRLEPPYCAASLVARDAARLTAISVLFSAVLGVMP
jgi:hypothetical protein